MRVLTILIYCLLGGACLMAAAPPRPAKAKKETGPVKIDFATLPDPSKEDYTIRLTLRLSDNTRVEETYTIGANTGVSAVRDLIKVSLGNWNVEAVGDDKLIIRGYKASQLAEADVRVIGLKGGFKVLVHPLTDEKPKSR